MILCLSLWTEGDLGLNISSLHPFLLFFAFLVEVKKAPIVHVFHKPLSLNPSKFLDLLPGAREYIQVVLGQSTQEYRFELAFGKAEKQPSDYFLESNSLSSVRNPDGKERLPVVWGSHSSVVFFVSETVLWRWNLEYRKDRLFLTEIQMFVTSYGIGHSRISDMQSPTVLDFLFQLGPWAAGLIGSVLWRLLTCPSGCDLRYEQHKPGLRKSNIWKE